MKPEKLIVYSLLCCVLFTILGLIVSPQIALVHRVSFAAILCLAIAYNTLQWRWPRWIIDAAALLVLALSLIYGIWFAEYPILAAIYFVGYVILLRLFQLETPRDFLLALLISLFQISADSLLLISLMFFVFFAGWLFSGLFSLSLVTIYARSPVKKPLVAPQRLLALLGSASAISLLFGVALFFFMPRIGFSLISLPLNSARSWEGYGPTIKVDEMNTILTNRTPVLRVQVADHDRPIEGIRWRMRAMEYFEEGESLTWRDRSGNSDTYPLIYNQPVTVDQKPPKGEQITQEIYLEPGIGPALPAAPVAYAYEPPYKFRSLECSFNQYCSLPFAPFERVHYLAYSSLPEYLPAEINQALASFDEFSSSKGNAWVFDLLQLPKDSDALCALARSATSKAKDPSQKIDALQEFFEKNYSYSLAGLPTGKNALRDFLFKSKKGNCEFFSTSGTLMLRCLNIPSRMAAGFISGEWNDYQKYYLVRESDAHTWVEIFLPGKGFMAFDPTPASGRNRHEKTSLFFKIMDPVSFLWNRWIFEYSIQDQLRGLRRMQAEGYRVKFNMRYSAPNAVSWLKTRPVAGIGVIALATCVILVVFAARNLRNPNRRYLKTLSPDQRAAAEIYLDMLDVLRKKGVDRKDSDTGLESAEKIAPRSAARRIIRRITNFYYQARFGKHKTGEKSIAQARADLEELKKQKTLKDG